MAEWMEQFFRQELNAVEERLRPALISGDLEIVFREFGLLRLHIAEAMKNALHQCSTGEGPEDFIEFQAQMNAALDGRLQKVVEKLIENRTEAARRDALTRLLNRAAFDERLRSEFVRARRYNRQFSLILSDIDCLKTVNDLYGHMAGDKVLINVARILQSSLRRSDVVFRYGGDEFAAICPETPKEAVCGIMRRVEDNIRLWARETRFAETIGISWGLASSPDPMGKEEIDEYELIRIADQQLYLCKKVHHKQLAARR